MLLHSLLARSNSRLPSPVTSSLCLYPTSGLDEAILGSSNPEDPEADSGRIARLLKHGAHSLAAAEQNQHGEAFQSENIDEVRADAGNFLSVQTREDCILALMISISRAGSWRRSWAGSRNTPYHVRPCRRSSQAAPRSAPLAARPATLSPSRRLRHARIRRPASASAPVASSSTGRACSRRQYRWGWSHYCRGGAV